MLALVASGAACGARPAAPDACFTCGDASVDRHAPEAHAGNDAIASESSAGDVSDGGVDALADSARTDTVRLDSHADVPRAMGACVPAGPVVALYTEARSIARPVYLLSEGPAHFVAGTRMLMGGLDNVFFFRVAADSTLVGYWNVSDEFGASVEGGAIARNGVSGYVMAFSSNRAGALDPYVRGLAPEGPPLASYAQVSGEGTRSAGAQIVATPGGHVVVWRSDDLLGAMTLRSAAVTGSTLTPGSPWLVSPPGVSVGAFELVADGANLAVAYQSIDETGTMDAYVIRLNADASASGAPIAVTAGARVTGSIGAALRGGHMGVVWIEPRFDAALHTRLVDLSTGTAGAQLDVPMAGFAMSDVTLSLDGSSAFVAAFRESSGTGSIAMVRLDGALQIRDGVSTVAPAAPSGDVVRVASNGAGLYAIGWSDETLTGARGWIQLMTCP